MLRQTLRSFGLTENEARAYEALIRFGRQTPAELAPRAGVSRGRVYQVLNEMLRKGLATEVPGQTRSFMAVEPRVALTTLLAERRAELEETEALIEVVTNALTQLRPEEPPAAPAIEVLTRPEQISQHYQKALADAEREVLSFSKAPYVDRGINQGELDALTRGVAYRVVYETHLFDDPAAATEVRRYVDTGEQARMLDEVPMKLVIFDRREALMPLATTHEPSHPFTSVVVHDEGLARTLALSFDHVWEMARPLPRSDDWT